MSNYILPYGDEIRQNLQFWNKGQRESERLACALLQNEGYTSLDPTHPLGGPDGGKDAVCFKGGRKYVVAVYFPHTPQDFNTIKKKFVRDVKGAQKNEAAGISFVTNQHITDGQRKELDEQAGTVWTDIFHLDRLVLLLINPINFGIRQLFLGIDVTKEELLAFHAARDKDYLESLASARAEIHDVLTQVKSSVKHLEALSTGGNSYCYLRLIVDPSKDFSSLIVQRIGIYPIYEVKIDLFVQSVKEKIDKSSNLVHLDVGNVGHGLSRTVNNWHRNNFKDYWKKNIKSQRYEALISARNGIFKQQFLFQKVEERWVCASRISKLEFPEQEMKLVREFVDQDYPKNLKGEVVWDKEG